jgi:hypothetical protein
MALIKCKECGSEFSSKSKSCLKCGNPNKKSSAGCLLAIILFVAFTAIIGNTSNSTNLSRTSSNSSSTSDFKAPVVPISKLAGTYVEPVDGILSITVKEVYSDSGMYGGWNGRIIFSPAIGDWTAQPRCRIYGNTLAVEIPNDGTIIKMFQILDPSTIRGDLSPWKGTFIKKD